MDVLATIREKLQQIKPDLVSKYHISSIGLFGSIVRDDFTPESDIDIVVDFNEPIGIEFIDLANELEAIFKRRVDLVSKNGIKTLLYEGYTTRDHLCLKENLHYY